MGSGKVCSQPTPLPSTSQLKPLKSCQSLGRGVTNPCWLPFCSGYAVSVARLLNQQLKIILVSTALARQLWDVWPGSPSPGVPPGTSPTRSHRRCWGCSHAVLQLQNGALVFRHLHSHSTLLSEGTKTTRNTAARLLL